MDCRVTLDGIYVFRHEIFLTMDAIRLKSQLDLFYHTEKVEQESPADAGIPARCKNDEKNSSISKL